MTREVANVPTPVGYRVLNTGTRFKIGEKEYRLMNDDSIEAVVDDPRELTRAA